VTGGDVLAWTQAPERLRPNLVVAVETPDGERRIVKVHAVYPDEYAAERDALRHYAALTTPGVRAVRLIDWADPLRLLELEFVEGRLLAEGWPDAGTDADLTADLARVMRALWAAPADETPWRALQSWLGALRIDQPGLDPALLARANALADELQEGVEPVVLHGDLHHENVLRRTDGELVAIDPKGILGAPGFDVGALLWNPIGRVLDQPRPGRLLAERLEVLAAELAIDAAELRAWGWVAAVLSAAWEAEDGQDPSDPLGIAALLDPVSR
jgi:streptomycin 6-kinase